MGIIKDPQKVQVVLKQNVIAVATTVVRKSNNGPTPTALKTCKEKMQSPKVTSC